MFNYLDDLPDHVIGVEVTGKITANDYKDSLIPLIEEKLKAHQRLDFICRIDSSWEGIEPGAMWQDLRIGLSNMSHWGRIAIVTDVEWIENSVNLFKVFWPGHLRHFDADEFEKAKTWACDQNRATIEAQINHDDGILTLEPSQDRSLSEDDFNYVTRQVDDYLQDHEKINGILISTRHFPGWQSLAAMLSHLKFVRDHHRKIERIAVVTNSPLGKFADHVTDHFIKAQVKSFEYDQQDLALSWLKRDSDQV